MIKMSITNRLRRKLGWPILVKDIVFLVIDPYYVEYVQRKNHEPKKMGEENYVAYISRLEQALKDIKRKGVEVLLYEMKQKEDGRWGVWTGDLSQNLIREGIFDFVREYFFVEGPFCNLTLVTDEDIFSPDPKEIYLTGSLLEMCLIHSAIKLKSLNPENRIFLVYDLSLSATNPQKTPDELKELYEGAGIDITIVISDQLDFLKPTNQ